MTLLCVVQGPSTINTLLATSAGVLRHLTENTQCDAAAACLQCGMLVASALLVAEAVHPRSFEGLCL